MTREELESEMVWEGFAIFQVCVNWIARLGPTSAGWNFERIVIPTLIPCPPFDLMQCPLKEESAPALKELVDSSHQVIDNHRGHMGSTWGPQSVTVSSDYELCPNSPPPSSPHH